MTSSYFMLHAFLGKFEGFCSPGSGVEMDHEIWQAMPNELLPDIFLRLPSRAFVRFRAVSKGFDRLLTSPAFLKKHASLQQTPATGMPVCGIHLYHSSTSVESGRKPPWPEAPNFSFESSKQILKVDLGFLPEIYRDLSEVGEFAADDGLVCVWKYRFWPTIGQKAWSFCVFNPVTRRFVCLPAHGFYLADGTRVTIPRGGEAYHILKVCICVIKAEYGCSFPSQFLVMVLCQPAKDNSPTLASLYSSVSGTWNCGWITDHSVKQEYNFPQYLLSSTKFLAAYYLRLEQLFVNEYRINGEGTMFNHESDADEGEDMLRVFEFENPYAVLRVFEFENPYAVFGTLLVEYGQHLYSVHADPEEDWDVSVVKLNNPAPDSSLEPGSCDLWETVSTAPSIYLAKGFPHLKRPDKCSLRVNGALVAGDAIYIILAMRNKSGRPASATRILQYNILQSTWQVEEELRHICISTYQLFLPRF